MWVHFIMARHHRPGFAPIEVLVAVVVVVVLATVVLPEFSVSNGDIRLSALKFNLHTVQSQIDAYRDDHRGRSPALATFMSQMTNKTDAHGTIGQGSAFRYGPYLQGPGGINPFNGSNSLKATTATMDTHARTAVDGSTGWLYNEATGDLFPNTPEYYRD